MSEQERFKMLAINNREIEVLIHVLKVAIPPEEEQDTIFNLVNRLHVLKRQ